MDRQLIKAIDETVRHMQNTKKDYNNFELSKNLVIKGMLGEEIPMKDSAQDIFNILEEESLVTKTKHVFVNNNEGNPKNYYRLTVKGRLYKSWKEEQKKKLKPITIANRANLISVTALIVITIIEVITNLDEIIKFFSCNR